MRIISKKTILQFVAKHTDARAPFQAWYDFAKQASWVTPRDIQRDFDDDVIIPGNRAVFNIKGNRYRLVASINYKAQILYILFIGTHKEYDQIDATKITYRKAI